MRDRMLHDALHSITVEAAGFLESCLEAGEEISFEIGSAAGSNDKREVRGGATALYAYRPLTAEFVSTHADGIRRLPGFELAASNLARTRGTLAYLRLRGEPALEISELTQARLGVLAFLGSVWADAEHFTDHEARFDVAYRQLESVALAARIVTTVFAPIHGVVLDSGTVDMGGGVELIPVDELETDCELRFAEQEVKGDCFCAISVDAPSDAPMPLAEVRRQARATLTALRLFKPGSVSLGLTAQANCGGAWRGVPMSFSGRSSDVAWRLSEDEAVELRQFIHAVRRVQRRTRIAWALRRFEMGLERTVPAEGLTDYMLALRALVEANDDAGRAALPARIAALCARKPERPEMRSTIEAALALERLAINGAVARSDRKRLDAVRPLEVIGEVERSLRALLHDLVCGYLANNLKAVADDILLADGELVDALPPAAEAEEVYFEPVQLTDEHPALARVAADPEIRATHEFASAVADRGEFDELFADTVEIAATDLRVTEPDEAVVHRIDSLVADVNGLDDLEVAPEAVTESFNANFATGNGDGGAADSSHDDGADIVELEMADAPEQRMRGIAERMVDQFEADFDEAMDTPSDSVIARPVRTDDRGSERSFQDDEELTFDFAVLPTDQGDRAPSRFASEPAESPALANGAAPSGRSLDAPPTPAFEVKEFEPPAAPDIAGWAGLEVVADEMVQPRSAESSIVAWEDNQPVKPSWSVVDAQPAPKQTEPPQPAPQASAPPTDLDSRSQRPASMGPPTIEFSPVEDADLFDPDDFAGAV